MKHDSSSDKDHECVGGSVGGGGGWRGGGEGGGVSLRVLTAC